MLQPGTVCAMALPAMRIEPSGAPQDDLVAVVRAVSTRANGNQPQRPPGLFMTAILYRNIHVRSWSIASEACENLSCKAW